MFGDCDFLTYFVLVVEDYFLSGAKRLYIQNPSAKMDEFSFELDVCDDMLFLVEAGK